MTVPASAPDRIVLLGLDGGPRLRPVAAEHPSAKPALALVVEGAVYLVDVGLDTARQLVASDLGFADVGDVFLTHHHFDHTSGLPGLLLHGWAAPRRLPDTVDLWGPPAMDRVVEGVLTAFAEELRLFSHGDVFGPFPHLVGHDVVPPAAGVHHVMEDDRVVCRRRARVPRPRGRRRVRLPVHREAHRKGRRLLRGTRRLRTPDSSNWPAAATCSCTRCRTTTTSGGSASRFRPRRAPPSSSTCSRRTPTSATSRGWRTPPARAGSCSATTRRCRVSRRHLVKAQAIADEIGYAGEIIAPSELDVIEL